MYLANSTTRDAVLLTHNYITKDLVYTAASLRYVDRNCRIILLIQENIEITSEVSRILSYYYIELFFTSKLLTLEINSIVPVVRRFFSEYAWLKKYGKDIDRVFHSDSTDILYTGSPFNLLRHDMITFVSEGVRVKMCPMNKNWLKQLMKDRLGEYEIIKRKKIINGGTIGGGVKEYLIFLKEFTKEEYIRMCRNHSFCDQPLIIWLVHSERLNKAKYNIKNCNSGFVTMTYCRPNLQNMGNITNWYPYRVSVYHQFTRYESALQIVRSQCNISAVKY